MVNKAPATTKKMSQNLSNAMSLVHSAADLSKELHDFSTWLSDDRFTNTVQNSDKVLNSPFIKIDHPLAFEDYNLDNQCMGVGLRTLQGIHKDSDILKIKM